MVDMPVLTTCDDDCGDVTPFAYECKFTINSRGNTGGDWEHNVGGMHEEKLITFDGYASTELYAALIDAVKKVSGTKVGE